MKKIRIFNKIENIYIYMGGRPPDRPASYVLNVAAYGHTIRASCHCFIGCLYVATDLGQRGALLFVPAGSNDVVS